MPASPVNSSHLQVFRAPAPCVLATLSKPGVSQRISKAVSSFFLWGVNRLFTRIILPSLAMRISEAERQTAFAETGARRVRFETFDKASLDGMLIRGGLRKAVLYVGGNGEYYEGGAEKFMALRQSVGDISVFAFNPRGVGASRGVPNAPGLARDVHAAFRYLVDVEKLNPSDIVIYGHSLGAGYGAEGAALVQQDFPNSPIHFVSSRSFTDLRTEVLTLANQVLPRWLKCLLLPLVKRLLIADRWQLDELGALQKLRGRKLVIFNQADTVIPPSCSLYQGIKKAEAFAGVDILKMDPHFEPHIDGVDPRMRGQWHHCRDFNSWERYEVANHLKQMLQLPREPTLDPRMERYQPRSEPQPPKWARGYLNSMEAIARLRLFTQLPAGASNEEVFRKMRIARSACEGILLKRSYAPAKDWFADHWRSISGIDRFAGALNRTDAELALHVLREGLGKVNEAAIWEQSMGARLEAIPVHPNDGFAGNNYRELLQTFVAEQCRTQGVVEDQATPAMRQNAIQALLTRLEALRVG